VMRVISQEGRPCALCGDRRFAFVDDAGRWPWMMAMDFALFSEVRPLHIECCPRCLPEWRHVPTVAQKAYELKEFEE